jgi:hypothetical protein
VEAVRPEVDGGERVVLHGGEVGAGWPGHLSTVRRLRQRRSYDFAAASISSIDPCRTSLPLVM